MGLFDRRKEPVFLKESSSAAAELLELKALTERIPAEHKVQFERDLKLLSAGVFGEQAIDFELRNSHMPMMVLHDLHLVSGALSAQIDYLIVTRGRNFVIECKNMIGNIEINSSGDFIRTIHYSGRPQREGIYSPITQNVRHLELIREIRGGSKGNFLSKAFFEKNFESNYRSVVVLANPKTVLDARYAKAEIRGQVIRADQLIAHIKAANAEPGAPAGSGQQMEELAHFFLSLHREGAMNHVEKYRALCEQEPLNGASGDRAGGQTEPASFQEVRCPKCGAPMVRRKAAKGSNAGKEFYGCSRYPSCCGTVDIPS